MRILSLVILLLLTTGSAMSQCPDPDKFIKVKEDKKDFYENSQSKSGYIRAGEIFETVFICQGGYDYRFTLGMADDKAGSLKYEVYEMVVNKKNVNGKSTYVKEKNVLHNSLSAGSIYISSDETRKIYFRILLEGGNTEETYCSGILVEFKKKKKIGF